MISRLTIGKPRKVAAGKVDPVLIWASPFLEFTHPFRIEINVLIKKWILIKVRCYFLHCIFMFLPGKQAGGLYRLALVLQITKAVLQQFLRRQRCIVKRI